MDDDKAATPHPYRAWWFWGVRRLPPETSPARRWFPSRRSDARRTRIRRSPMHRAARPDRGHGGIAASDARRSDDAARGRLRISGVPWVFSPDFIIGSRFEVTGQTRGWANPWQPLKAAREAWLRRDFRAIPCAGILRQFSLAAMDRHEPRSRPYRSPIPDCSSADGLDCTHPARIRRVARGRAWDYRNFIR